MNKMVIATKVEPETVVSLHQASDGVVVIVEKAGADECYNLLKICNNGDVQKFLEVPSNLGFNLDADGCVLISGTRL